MDHSCWCAVIHTEPHRMRIQLMLYCPDQPLSCLVPQRALPKTLQSYRAAGATKLKYELLANKQERLGSLKTKQFWQHTQTVNACICLIL